MQRTARTILVAVAALAGCGGSSAKYKVDDVALAQIPVAEKQGIFNAENDVSVARSERQKAEADARADEDDANVADKEREQARLEVQKLRLERDAAQRSHDENKLHEAERALKVAEVGERAATAKSDWLGARRKYHRSLVDQADEHEALARAKVELEKAKLAQAKNIKPGPDFRFSDFTDEYNRRDKRLGEARVRSDERKADLDKSAQSYEDLKTQYASMSAKR